jgi:hypothetical protein
LFFFYNDINGLGMHDMSITFGSKNVPKFDNYTVVIKATVQNEEENVKVQAFLKINIKIR